RTAEAIEKAGGQVGMFQADLSMAEQARGLVLQVLARYTGIDVLVNNAGSLVARKAFLELTDEFWQQAMDVNLNSAFWVTRAAVPHMVARGSGSIINVGSIAGRNGGGPGAMPYATAKAALTCFTKGLAKELIAYGIRVNAVNPGVILTPFHETFSTAERMKAMVSMIPQGRAGTSEEISGVIAFLASGAASHIVGESIEINGGMLMD
ncbi:MAG TPA: SDR family NAD(P)-dependent oxidoreductase, partial [Bryobacterales bacterium]|nr:SDR family NAD(P)-dependent oxidoreductase [Bryobacterales bacterium]